MSTLVTTDSFTCRIELSTVKKWTTHLPCTQSHPVSSVRPQTFSTVAVLQHDDSSNEMPIETHGVCLGNAEGPLIHEAFNFLETNIQKQ